MASDGIERTTFADDTGRGPFIQTFTGGRFYYENPHVWEVSIKDIAHALANNCRYNGHTRKFYSVAEHCVLGSYEVPRDDALAFLLHDANEAYLTDIPSPLKTFLDGQVGSMLRDLEARIDRLIFERFKVPYPATATVRLYDLRMLATEVKQIMPDPDDYRIADITPIPELVIECWSPKIAEEKYLNRFLELYNVA